MEFSGALSFSVFLSYVGMGDKTWDQRLGWARQVVNLFHESGSAEEWPLLLGAVAMKAGVYPTPPPKPGLQNPELRLDFSARTLDFEIPPHKDDARYRVHRRVKVRRTRGNESITRLGRASVIRSGSARIQRCRWRYFRRTLQSHRRSQVTPQRWTPSSDAIIRIAEFRIGSAHRN